MMIYPRDKVFRLPNGVHQGSLKTKMEWRRLAANVY